MTQKRMTAEDRKLAIVRAALPLFAKKGFAKTTTRELARAARISEPLLYKHFPSKEALYLEIQNYSCSSMDPTAQRLNELKPSTSTLVHLIYFFMRALVLGRPRGETDWGTRHRLMIQSFMEDGVYARLTYENRFNCFCSQIKSSIAAATTSGDMVPSPISKENRSFFAHHVGAYIALVHLPKKPTMDYNVSPEELMNHAVWFVLRGMGMTDKALAAHYNPKALALMFGES